MEIMEILDLGIEVANTAQENGIPLLRTVSIKHQLRQASQNYGAALKEAWCQNPKWKPAQQMGMISRVKGLKQEQALLMKKQPSIFHPVRSVQLLADARGQRRLSEQALRDAKTTSYHNRVDSHTEPLIAVEMTDQVTGVYNAIEPGIGGTSESSDEGLGTADDGGYEATLIGSASTESLTESFITAQEDPAWPYDIAGANNYKTPTRATFASNERTD